MAEQKSGCLEWIPLVVILLIGGFIFLSTEPFGNPYITTREAEVKQNLHAIQLAIERYACDHDGQFPMFLMGGDWTDSYAVNQKYCNENSLSDHKVTLAPTGMGDMLMMEGYMPVYPENPFKKIIKSKLRLVLEHCNYQGEITTRFVGGRDSRAMVEVVGPRFIQAGQQVNGDFFVHHIFNNPRYDLHDMRKEQGVNWNKPSGNKLLVGNFSYYPRAPYDAIWHIPNEEGNNNPIFDGYTLAGYGSIRTPGQDVYNRNGNYKGIWGGHHRTEPCEVDCSDAEVYPDDIPCICPGDGTLEPTMYQNYGGSDTLPDGVVTTLDGGPSNTGPQFTTR